MQEKRLEGVRLVEEKICTLTYVDDIMMLRRNEKVMARLITELEKYLDRNVVE